MDDPPLWKLMRKLTGKRLQLQLGDTSYDWQTVPDFSLPMTKKYGMNLKKRKICRRNQSYR